MSETRLIYVKAKWESRVALAGLFLVFLGVFTGGVTAVVGLALYLLAFVSYRVRKHLAWLREGRQQRADAAEQEAIDRLLRETRR